MLRQVVSDQRGSCVDQASGAANHDLAVSEHERPVLITRNAAVAREPAGRTIDPASLRVSQSGGG